MTQPGLGQRLRAVRHAHGYTLAEVAQRAGVSKSFLSMLETGHTNVSATRLQRLSAVFGLKTSDLLPDEAARELVRVVRRGAATPLSGFGDGVAARLLGLDVRRRLQPVVLTLAPGAEHETRVGHAGEEFVFVLSGSVSIQVDREAPVRLEAGDSAYYPAALPHGYANLGTSTAELLTIATPGSLARG